MDDQHKTNPGILSTPKSKKASSFLDWFPRGAEACRLGVARNDGLFDELSKIASLRGELAKFAGFRIEYDIEMNPVRTVTGDEWLTSMFKRDGSFMVHDKHQHMGPLSKHGMAAFADELRKIAEHG